MLRILVFFLALSTLPALPQAAPTKRVVTLEAVFDSNEKRLSLNSKQIHGDYSRFMELSGKGNLCPRTITHLSDGNHDMSGISLPHKEIKHDGTNCQDKGKLMLTYERKLTSDAIAKAFGLQEDATGFKASIRRVLLSLDGFYIGIENVTRSCGRSSFSKGAAVIITSDSEPFGKEFHIPFHGHPKVMLINDKHKACAFTSTWGSPSPIPVQPEETQKSRYGPVSVTTSPSPAPSGSQPPMPSFENTKPTSAPSSSEIVPSLPPRQPSNVDNTDTSDAETFAPAPSSSVQDRETPRNKDTTSSSTPSQPDQSQAQKSAPTTQMPPESTTATPTGVAASQGEQPSPSPAASIMPNSPKEVSEPESAEEAKEASAPQGEQSSPSAPASMMPASPKKIKDPGSAEGTNMESPHPSQTTNSEASTTPSSGATSKQSPNEVTEPPYPSGQDVPTAPTRSPSQTIQPATRSPEASPMNVLSSARSPKPSIYPDASKAPRIVDMAPTRSSSPKPSGDVNKKGKKSSQEEEIALVGSHSQSAKPSTGGPLIFFGQKPSASLLPSLEVSYTPIVQESPSAQNNPEATESGASQSATASVGSSSTPSPSIAVVLEEDGSACFPADAMAVGENGNLVRVEDLQVGNKVQVGDNQFSHIIDFSHADGNIVLPFVRFITVSGKALTVTASHYIYTQRGLFPAREVSASDSLILSNGTQIIVSTKTQRLARGLFNPHTSHGDIIIDGFKVSTYTSAVEPTIAHALMVPIRLLDIMGSRPTLLSSFVRNPVVMRYFNIRSS